MVVGVSFLMDSFVGVVVVGNVIECVDVFGYVISFIVDGNIGCVMVLDVLIVGVIVEVTVVEIVRVRVTK